MRTLFIFFLSTLFLVQCLSQVQMGLVREQNSGKRVIAGAEVIFEDAVPTVSDNKGQFRLAFVGKKPGDRLFFSSIRKSGFELVNGIELNRIQFSNNDSLSVDIILAKKGTIDAAKKEYYAVSDKALRSGFEKRKKELREQIRKAQITQQEYQEKFKVLQGQYENQRQSLDRLAEKFARVNFDDVSKVYQEALELFKAGKVYESIEKLESAGYMDRSDKHLQERKRIDNALEEMQAQDEENEKGIKKDVEALFLKAKSHIALQQDSLAQLSIEHLLLLYPEDLKFFFFCADFFSEKKLRQKELEVYQQILKHPRMDPHTRIIASNRLNELLINKK